MSLKYEPASEPLHIYLDREGKGLACAGGGEVDARKVRATSSSVFLSSLELSDTEVYEP